jgi:hypothetical protein
VCASRSSRTALRPRRLGIGVVRRPERSDEQLRRDHLAGRSVDHLERRAGVIDEQALAGNVALPATAAPPRRGRARSSGYTVAVGVDSAMLFPQQLQRHPWPTQLPVDRRPVWLRPTILGRHRGGRE